MELLVVNKPKLMISSNYETRNFFFPKMNTSPYYRELVKFQLLVKQVGPNQTFLGDLFALQQFLGSSS